MKVLWDSPWYVPVTCLAIGLLFSVFLYRNRRNDDVPRRIRWLMAALRFLTVSACCFLLSAVMLRQVENEEQEPVVVIAVDNSSSMVAGKDSAYVKGRLLPEIESLRRRLSDRYEVATLYFGSSAQAVRPELPFTQKETDINDLLGSVGNDFANQNVGALVLVSDGIYNKGSNPAFAAQSLAFPVYAVGVGDTAEQRDVLIRRIDHNQIAYLGNNFPVIVQLAAKKAAGREVKVEILQGNSVKASSGVRIDSDNFSVPVTFTLNAGTAGLMKYRVRVTETGIENNKRNNEQEFVVEVLDNKEKILLLAAAPHPDVGAIREAILANTSYALSYFPLSEMPRQIAQYNLVIVHGYSPAAAGIIQECRNNRIPFWIVNPASADGLPGVKISTGLNRTNEVEPFVDESFGLFSVSRELRAFLTDVPALSVFFGNYQLPTGSTSLLLQRIGAVETNNPVLFFSAADDVRFGVFIGDGLWRWKLRDFAMHGNTRLFAELISKSVQYLAAREDKSYFRLAAPRIISDNDVLEMSAELYDKSYEPVNAPDVVISLVNEREQKYNYTFSKTGRAYRLSIGTLPAGEYRYRASVSHAGETFTRLGSIVIRETVAERVNTVADHTLLRQMAARSGGGFYRSDQLGALGNELAAAGKLKTVVYSQTITRPLIDEKMIFFALLGLLAVEWFLRKRFLAI